MWHSGCPWNTQSPVTACSISFLMSSFIPVKSSPNGVCTQSSLDFRFLNFNTLPLWVGNNLKTLGYLVIDFYTIVLDRESNRLAHLSSHQEYHTWEIDKVSELFVTHITRSNLVKEQRPGAGPCTVVRCCWGCLQSILECLIWVWLCLKFQFFANTYSGR